MKFILMMPRLALQLRTMIRERYIISVAVGVHLIETRAQAISRLRIPKRTVFVLAKFFGPRASEKLRVRVTPWISQVRRGIRTQRAHCCIKVLQCRHSPNLNKFGKMDVKHRRRPQATGCTAGHRLFQFCHANRFASSVLLLAKWNEFVTARTIR